MKNFGTVGERYCPAQRRNVPVEIWWDNDGNRQEPVSYTHLDVYKRQACSSSSTDRRRSLTR